MLTVQQMIELLKKDVKSDPNRKGLRQSGRTGEEPLCQMHGLWRRTYSFLYHS